VISPEYINLLGECADYNDGVVLPAAVDCYVTLVIKPQGDDRVILRALDLDDFAEYSLKELDKRRDLRGEPLPEWAFYPAAVHI